MLAISDCSLAAKTTTLLSPSQAGLPLMSGYVHQPSLGYPMTNRLSSMEIERIAKLPTFTTSFFFREVNWEYVLVKSFSIPAIGESNCEGESLSRYNLRSINCIESY